MTPEAALIELLARVGARNDATVLVSAEELGPWPAAAIAAMKSQGLLAKARPAASAICPGCERECTMPVHTVPTGPLAPASFIVCDKRSDINRVPVSAARLAQWRCDAGAVRKFIAMNLGLRLSDQHHADPGLLNIGIALGSKRSQMLCLRTDRDLSLVAGNNSIPLPDLIGFHDGKYSVDVGLIRQLVDSTTTADPRHIPNNARREARKLGTQAVHEDWRKAYRDLKKKHGRAKSDVWYSLQIAKGEFGHGRRAETIRKHMKK
jgi:hypothetical protein